MSCWSVGGICPCYLVDSVEGDGKDCVVGAGGSVVQLAPSDHESEYRIRDAAVRGFMECL